MAAKKGLKKANINIKNKRAEFDYFVLDRYTAGIVLTGTEIKSISTAGVRRRRVFKEYKSTINAAFQCYP